MLIAKLKTFNFLIPIALFLLTLTVYALTLSPYVLLEDDGGFIMASYFNGVAHPPGYPLFALIGYVFTQFDISTVAARVHFVSAFFGSLTIVFIYHIVKLLDGRYIPAVFAALLLAFSIEFWSQSIISEVYTLNTALFFFDYFLVLWVHQQYKKGIFDQTSKYVLYLAAFVLGLGLSNHWPLFVLSSLGLFVLVLPFYKEFLRLFLRLFVCVLLGLSPYVWMYYFGSNKDDFIAFGEIRNFQELIFYISRKGYAAVDQSSTSGWSEKWSYLVFFIQQLIKQFSIVAVLAVGVIPMLLWRKAKIVSLSLVLVFCGSSLFLIALLGFDFSGFYRIIFKPYPLISYGVVAIFLGVGLGFILQYIEKTKLAWVFFLIPVLYFSLNYSKVDDSKNAWAEDYAYFILSRLPQNSILFVNGDVDTGPIAYVRYIKKFREDVDVYQENGIYFPNRLFRSYYELEFKSERINALIKQSNRPAYATQQLAVDGLAQENIGLLFRLGDSEDIKSLAIENLHYIKQLRVDGDEPDWVDIHKYTLSEQLVRYFLDHKKIEGMPEDDYKILTSSDDFKIIYLSFALGAMDSMPANYFDEYLVYLDNKVEGILLNSTKALYFYCKAMILIKKKNQPEQAIPLLERSVKLNPSSNNAAIKPLFEWYVIHREDKKIERLSQLTLVEFKY